MILLTVMMVVAGGSDSHMSMVLMQLSGGEVNDGTGVVWSMVTVAL